MPRGCLAVTTTVIRLHLSRAPVLTTALTAATAVVSVSGLLIPPVLRALQRTPEGLHGEVWRWLTSLLVQDGGVAGTASNLLFLAVLGTAAEQVDWRPALLGRYLVTGLVGQVAGVLWQPVGAGNSVAVCGLAGLCAWSVTAMRTPSWAGPAVALWLGALLATWWPPLIAVGVLGAVADRVVLRRCPDARVAATVSSCFVVAAALVAVGNLHGPALAVGTLLGAWSRGSPLRRRRQTTGGSTTAPVQTPRRPRPRRLTWLARRPVLSLEPFQALITLPRWHHRGAAMSTDTEKGRDE